MLRIQGFNQIFYHLRGGLIVCAMLCSMIAGLNGGCSGQNAGIAAGRPVVTLPTESYLQRGETLNPPAATLSLEPGPSLAFSRIETTSNLESK